ncbi:response regulator [Aliivibrio finisterrensis]|uniref:response regulator n=1 Tax=Aliivibrio TaxID=511678 RepID=UPI00101FB6BF|nr:MULTISPECIES: response regulator [Aliivibrio]MDD9174625.1 response regulator [Aliivibrio sp. S3TY1]MDD9191704.1 response regulator [Aliivibrio sp. S2TY2]RYU69583.1 response regulator [Aliivibrio finisterrensis]RYU73381.1 response regulator [Aliivibrio finisterrensis]RYU76335.1 response regulator [Aliivibrio finisterrensis]
MSSKISIVIVEDDIGIAEIHRRNLEKIDSVEVIGIAASKEEATLLFEVLNPDLVLLDIYLPDGNGLDILRELRQKESSPDVILITADRDVNTLQEAMRGGVVDYLLKPVIFSRLEEAINKYLSQKQQFINRVDIDQSMVDAMLHSTTAQSVARLPKGIDGVTLEKVRQLFSHEKQLTADQAGELIGASRTTARRYLEYLISSGELSADLSYGSVGRPERTYFKA